MRPDATRELQFNPLTESAINDLRGMIGQEVRRGQPYIEELSADAVRHFALGIGDRNPLWSDPTYAKSAVHGGLMAPPTILYATDRIVSGYVSGLPGIHAMFAGTEFRYERPLKVGDRIRAVATLKDLVERSSRFAGRSFQQTYEVRFFDQTEALVATADSYCFRTERDEARKRGKYDATVTRWSGDQVKEIGSRYQAQEARRQGSRQRYVESIKVGDELPEIIKGPYTATTAIAFLLGWGGLYVRAHGDAFDLFNRHPALAIANEFGVPEPPERVHWDPILAARVGVPGAYDYGPERVSWMGQVVTDWMGDDGFLRVLRVEVRRHNLIGELVTCHGRVSAIDLETSTAHLDLIAHNQDGHESARGSAQVILPQRLAQS